MFLDGFLPPPPCPDCQPPGPVESFIGLYIVFWMFFFLVVFVLPSRWGDAIWKVAFPFAPRVEKPEPKQNRPHTIKKGTRNDSGGV
jgi:hypothetical protein